MTVFYKLQGIPDLPSTRMLSSQDAVHLTMLPFRAAGASSHAQSNGVVVFHRDPERRIGLGLRYQRQSSCHWG